jgi:septal ring factor EnvC (AmiA/AmiB activator)
MIETDTKNRPPESLDSPRRAADKKGSPLGIVCALLVAAVVIVAILYWNKNTSAASLDAKLVQANSDNTQLRSDLDKANSTAADLHRQLDAANTQQADLKSRLDAAVAQQASLKSDISKARSDLASEKHSAGDQQNALQGQLQQANDQNADLHKQLEQAKSESADLKSKLADAQTDLQKMQAPAAAAAKQEAVPVTAAFEKAIFGSRYTLHLKDVGHDPLTVTVSVDGAARSPAQLQPGATSDVSDLKAGQSVMISADGFQALSVTVK